MNVQFKPLHPLFAAECSGVDIAEPLPAECIDAIETGMNRYGVLVFRRAEPLSIEQQIAFAKQLGDFEPPYTRIQPDGGVRIPNAMVSDLSNLSVSNTLLEPGDRRRLSNLGNQLWHSDSSYKRVPARYSALCAHVIPPEGGDTEFADMRAAWNTLPSWLKQKVEGLVAEHSRIFSKGALGLRFTAEEEKAFEPVRQPLVRLHPATREKSLFLSSHAGRIAGLPVAEGAMLLRELTEHATQRELVYRHVWRVGDLVMWDNQTTMHRGRPYDDQKYPRDMRRVTLTCGAPAIAAGATA